MTLAMSGKRKEYSQECIDAVVRMRNKEWATIPAIIKRMSSYGLTEYGVLQILRNAGQYVSAARTDELKRMYYEERMTLQEIADANGISRQRVSQIVGNVARLAPKGRLSGHSGRHYTPSPKFKYLVALRKLFWPRIIFDRKSGCWIWDGCLQSCDTRYGRVSLGDMAASYIGTNSNSISPRVLSYFIAHGKIPNPKNFGSVCGNALCCNPEHFVLKEERGRGG